MPLRGLDPRYDRDRQTCLKGEPPTVSTTARAQTGQRASARERRLAAANELFYAEGVQTVRASTALSSGLGSPRHRFTDHLPARKNWWPPTLASRHEGTASGLEEAIAVVRRPLRQKDPGRVRRPSPSKFKQPDFNGCAFIAAFHGGAPPVGSWKEPLSSSARGPEACSQISPLRSVRPTLVKLGRQLHLVYAGRRPGRPHGPPRPSIIAFGPRRGR